MKPIIIQAIRANFQGDPLNSITYTLERVKKAFPDTFFQYKKVYEFTYKDGQKVQFIYNKGRLYSKKLGSHIKMMFVKKGPNPDSVFHEIISVRLTSNTVPINSEDGIQVSF